MKNVIMIKVIIFIFLNQSLYSSEDLLFNQAGWDKEINLEIYSARGAEKAAAFSKKINNKILHAIYISERSIVWFGEDTSHLILMNNKIMAINWRQPTHLIFSDFSSNIETKNDLAKSIGNAEEGFIKEPLDFTKIRQYKGAFGLVGSNENDMRDLTFGMIRTLKSFQFNRENLELTLSGSPTDVAIIELAPNLDYISSSVNGKMIDYKSVEARQIRTESEYRRSVNEKYKSNIYSIQSESPPSGVAQKTLDQVTESKAKNLSSLTKNSPEISSQTPAQVTSVTKEIWQSNFWIFLSGLVAVSGIVYWKFGIKKNKVDN